MLDVDPRLFFVIIFTILVAAMFGVRRFRWPNIIRGTAGYGAFVGLLAVAPGTGAIDPVLLVGLAFIAGAISQQAFDDEKHRERLRRASVGLTV